MGVRSKIMRAEIGCWCMKFSKRKMKIQIIPMSKFIDWHTFLGKHVHLVFCVVGGDEVAIFRGEVGRERG